MRGGGDEYLTGRETDREEKRRGAGEGGKGRGEDQRRGGEGRRKQ